MRAHLIANPHAGADRALEYIPLITEKLRTVVRDLDITVAANAEEARQAAARAVEDHCEALYVAGGDGTLNSALQGVASTGAAQLPIGLIPLGTGNDFAKALGLGEEPMTALDLLIGMQVLEVDLGTLNDRPFANTSAGGFIAEVSKSVTETLKNTTGKLAYLVGGAKALLGTEPFCARIVVHDRQPAPAPPAPLDVQLFAVCNARFIGGGYPIAPDACIDDGLLDVVVVPGMPFVDFVAALKRLSSGDYGGDGAILHFRAAAFDLEFDRTVGVNTDGEVLEARRCEYRVRRRAARFFCGPKPQAVGTPARWRG